MRAGLSSLLAFACLVACGGRVDGGPVGTPVVNPPPSDGPPGPSPTASTAPAPSPPSTGPSTAPSSQTLATFAGLVNAVAIDSTAVYVALDTGSVVRVPEDGSATTQIATTSINVEGLAVDDGYVYFTDLSDGTVSRVDKTGQGEAVLASGQSSPWGIALDAGNVYWVNQGDTSAGATGNSGSVMSVAKTGGTPAVLASGEQTPTEIATDGSSLYWLSSGWGSDNGTVRKIAIAGGAAPASLTTGLGAARSIALGAGEVLWTNNAEIENVSGSIGGVPTAGGPTTILYAVDDGPLAIASDGTHVYYGAQNAGSVGAIMRIPMDGGPGAEVMPAPPPAADTLVGLMVSFVLVDATSVYAFDYWAEQDGEHGRIRVAPK